MRARIMFAWYDMWVGVFWDKSKRRLYLLPVPCLGVRLDFATPTETATEGEQ